MMGSATMLTSLSQTSINPQTVRIISKTAESRQEVGTSTLVLVLVRDDCC